jgi:hypothetical protein
MLGGLGWLLLAATTDEPWPDALIMAAIWIGVALIGWEAPLIAALFLFLGAFIGTLLAFLVFIFDTLNQIDVKNGRDTRGEFWGYLGSWGVLPLVAAFRFIADVRRRLDES